MVSYLARGFNEKDAYFTALALEFGIPVWARDKDMVLYGIGSRRYVALDTRAVEKLLSQRKTREYYKRSSREVYRLYG